LDTADGGICVHLLLVTGFLGSGKTSLIIWLADAARLRGRAPAIVVNEIGDIGIDDQLLRRLDNNVWQLTSGCICCTLSGELVDTLHQLDQRDDVDLVIVEASGAADPKSVLAALPYYRGRELDSVRWVAVLDPFRLPMLLEVMTPLVEGGIGLADTVVVARCDLATADEASFAESAATGVNPSACVFRLDLTRALPPELIERLLPPEAETAP
jgi:G3E family GTPase